MPDQVWVICCSLDRSAGGGGEPVNGLSAHIEEGENGTGLDLAGFLIEREDVISRSDVFDLNFSHRRRMR